MADTHTAQTITEDLQPISADDAAIAEALEHAHIPTLMLALVHLTGDLSIVRSDIRPHMEFLGDPAGGITPEQQAQVRRQALQVLCNYRDHPQLPAPPSGADIREMLNFMIGEEVADDYVSFLTEELALEGQDPYAQPNIFAVPAEQRAAFNVLVIGAGMSGLLTAIRLQEAGIPFQIVEKNADVGGTWFENTYPGCRVDSANHTYSYSFRPNDWPQHFSDQRVLQKYFADSANAFGLRDRIRFNCEVTTARYIEADGVWEVQLVTPAGETETLRTNAVVSAVGQLNRPKIPDLQGLESFAGVAFHSAQWQHDHDLAGKRVGVIGTGASAFQFVPIISESAAQVTVFQRTPPWVVPNPEYFQEVPAGKHWLLNHVPFYAKWFRFSMFWRAAEGLLDAVRADPHWQQSEQSVSEKNQHFREMLSANLQQHLGTRPDLLQKCIPDYPPGAKRALIDDGTWLETLKRDNVQLLTDPIARVTPTGLVTEDGTSHEFDVLIYATGFKASRFLHPMQFYGKGGVALQDLWDGEPRAYKGITVPGFPNLFCCYGPNTNIVVNGSIIFFSECEVRYILDCLALLMANGHAAMDVRMQVHDAYNERIDAGNRQMAWGLSSVNTWYKNDSGRITQNWPFTLLEFWQQTRQADAADFHFT